MPESADDTTITRIVISEVEIDGGTGTVEGGAPPSAGLFAEVEVDRAERRSADTALGMRERGTLALERGGGGAEDIVAFEGTRRRYAAVALAEIPRSTRINTPGLYSARGQGA
jgi:hypothetical protein